MNGLVQASGSFDSIGPCTAFGWLTRSTAKPNESRTFTQLY
jgi:hypothetical protein